MVKRLALGLIAAISLAAAVSAQDSEEALTIFGAHGERLGGYTLAELRARDQITIETANEFVDGIRVFSGPLLREVLLANGIDKEAMVRLTAANDYAVEIDAAEFFSYDVILALTMDGVELSRRDKGPIWVIYPTSQFPELQDPVWNNRLIWQLVRIDKM